MDSAPNPGSSQNAPLATYSERLLEVKRDFALYSDRVVVRARWLLRGRYENVVPLRGLASNYKRFAVRYRLHRYAGWLLALGAFAFAILFYTAGGAPLGIAAYVAIGVAGSGATLLALSYPIRHIQFARFDTRAGRPGLDIGAGRGTEEAFREFVRAVQRQIERQ